MADTLIDKVRQAWGDPLPDWIETLALECMRTSQAHVARALQVSPAAVSNLLRRSYAASTERLEERARGVYLAGKVRCPALGDLPTNECLKWRDKATRFEAGSPLRALMYRTCNRCPRFTEKPTDDAEV